MPAKIKVFISSTMEDLANERQSVIEQVSDLQLEPVNAEGLLPNGSNSWNLLESEIKSSHIFILILGSQYGWIPKEGYGANTNKSVTHLETDLAKSLGIPIFPFIKKLKYGTDSSSDDAVRRDNFRKEISSWNEGVFRAEFDLAIDLGKKVKKALLDIFQDTFVKQSIRKIAASQLSIAGQSTELAYFSKNIHENKVKQVLFAGAGLSLAAGYPSANTLVDVLAQNLSLHRSGAELLSRYSFSELASLFITQIGRTAFVDTIKELFDTPLPVTPTHAHLVAVNIFPIIITTNYDMLFEQACLKQSIEYTAHTPSNFHPNAGGAVSIYKVDGSIEEPNTMVITDQDHIRVQNENCFLDEIYKIMNTHEVTVIGHSLRDITSQKIMSNRNMDLPGTYISPHLDKLTEIVLKDYNLKCIESDANTYLNSIAI